MSGLAEQSKWLQAYAKDVRAKAKKSSGNKWLAPFIIALMAGGVAGKLIYDGKLNDPQAGPAIKVMLGVAGFLVLLALLLIAKKKKTDPAEQTIAMLNELLTTPEEVASFDAQMAAPPKIIVRNQDGGYVFATDNLLGIKFNFMGDEKYSFAKISDVKVLHFLTKSLSDQVQEYTWCDANGRVLMGGHVDGAVGLQALLDGIQAVIPGVQITKG
ncbi:MAG: hypothetical protein IJM57_07315 [Lachnospiraceae bacterium]|nr:hypothetical protein [Lachnospiraceae bacterium]